MLSWGDLLYTQWIYSLDQGLNLWARSLICRLRGFAALLSLLFYHIMPCHAMPYPILSYPIPSHPIPSHPILSFPGRMFISNSIIISNRRVSSVTDVYRTKLLFTDEDENGNELPISGVCLLGAILVLYIDIKSMQWFKNRHPIVKRAALIWPVAP